jgi:hypothetical protein
MPISTINTNSIADDAVTVPKVTDQVLTHRNLIINGAMQVAQRGTSGSISTGNPNYASIDRFKTEAYDADQFVGTWTQVTDAPTGFSYSGKWTTTTAESAIDASELFDVRHVIEAQNVTHLNYGSVDAKTGTLSFWVKSSVTGTFTVNVYNMDSNRHLPKEYTIDSANTWEKKIITVIGDTGGNNFANDNGPGLQFTWNLAAGSAYSGTPVTGSWAAYSGPAWAGANQSNAVGTTLNATWQLTGVQFEVGDTATPFEHRSFGDELIRCQRYYEEVSFNEVDKNRPSATCAISNNIYFNMTYKVTKRTNSPSVTFNGGSIFNGSWGTFTSPTVVGAGDKAVHLTGTATAAQNSSYLIRNIEVTVDAEL